LPGSCDNLQDVANHWERIKLSYEILQDPTRRKRYDRADVLSNPGLALRRAVGKAALDTVASLGKGMFGIGASVVQHVVNAKTTTTSVSVQQQQQQQSSSSRDGSSSINSFSSNEQHVSKDQIVENV
jgi:DnaJ-class molecular chaperone